MRNQAIYKLVGRRLRHRRRGLELTQGQVGARCGLTFQQIQKYEAGLVDMPLARLVALSGVLCMPLAEILDGLQDLVGFEDRREVQPTASYLRDAGAGDRAVHA